MALQETAHGRRAVRTEEAPGRAHRTKNISSGMTLLLVAHLHNRLLTDEKGVALIPIPSFGKQNFWRMYQVVQGKKIQFDSRIEGK